MRAVHTFTLVADTTSKDVVNPSNHLLIFQLWFKLGDEGFGLVYTVVYSRPHTGRGGIHGGS